MSYLGRRGAVAPLTSGDIPDGVIEGRDIAFFENSSTTQNLSGTYSTERMYLNDSYTLTGNVTVTGHLALGTVADSDVVITQDSTERTITGSGTLESGELLSSKETDLTGMTGELGSVVTGSPALNLNNATFPKGHIIQTAHVMKTSATTISVAADTEVTIPNFVLQITPKYASSEILIFWTVHAVGVGNNPCMGTLSRSGHGTLNIGDASSNRARVGANNSNVTSYTVGGMSHTEIDSPNTTSEVTYTLGIRHHSSVTRVVNINSSLDDSDTARNPRTTSSMTAMEIAQ